MNPLASVVASGARTCLGLNAQQSAFIYRAGAAGMREAALLDSGENPVTLCRLDTLDPYLTGVDRAWALAEPAMEECIAPHLELLRQLRVEVLTCFDESYGRKDASGGSMAMQLGGQLQRLVKYRLGEKVETQTTTQGPAALGAVLPDLLARLHSGQSDAVILGGVHTDYDLLRIRDLEASGRLFTMENLDALLPGEGAAFVLLVHPGRLRQWGLRSQADLIGYGAGHENARPGNDQSAFDAAGLTLAVHRATEPLRKARLTLGWWINDLSFELFRVHEWQSVATRISDVLGEPHRSDAPAQRMGYLGGATLPFALVLAAEAWRRDFGYHGRALCTAGSEEGPRTALLLSKPV